MCDGIDLVVWFCIVEEKKLMSVQGASPQAWQVNFSVAEKKHSWTRADNPILPDTERPADFNINPFDDTWAQRPISVRFEEVAALHENRLAVNDGSQSLAYGELLRCARYFAQRIDASTEPGRPVGILLPHNACFPAAALACLAAGRPYVPIDLKYPQARVEAIIHEAGLQVIIIERGSDAARLLPDGAVPIEFDIAAAASFNGDMMARPAPVDRPAVILYTSGSTGKPKGICNDQRALLQRVTEYTESCGLNADDRFIMLSSPGTIAGEREMFAALLNGAALHITDPQKDGVHRVLEIMEGGRITVGYAVPALLRMLLRLPRAKQAFSHMRVLRVGGDITLGSDLALFREVAPPSCRFFPSFSSTETPAVFQWFVPPGWQIEGPRVPVGYARPGIEFMVLDDAGQPVLEGEAGELVVRSRYLALGHWQDGRLMPGPFIDDPDDPSMRILHTGDMVRRRPDGLWELTGRKDRQVKIRGQRIDAGEVEAALRGCEGVLDAAVISRRDGDNVTALAAFVAPRRPELLEPMKSALAARVPRYMHPAAIHLVDAIPQLPGFKPDIRALEALDREELRREAMRQVRQVRQSEHGGAKPKTATDRDNDIWNAVKHAWTIVIGAKSFEADRPWNESDADSLKALELWFYIEDKLGFKLPLDTLSDNATPSRLVATIKAHLADMDAERDSADSGAPVVFLMPGIQSDDPALAKFRATFGNRVRFKLIDYPPWRQMNGAANGFEAVADWVFRQICAAPPCDVYRLAGYSFGGIVAFDVARRLVESGRRVDFLGLLDSRRWDIADPAPPENQGSILAKPQRLPVEVVKWMIATLVRRRWYAPLGMIERLLMLRPTRVAFWFKRQLTKTMRYEALRQWKPQPIDVPTVLFLSDQHWPGEPENYGWDEVCVSLSKEHIGGTHATIIQSPQRESLCARFLQLLQPQATAVR